MFSITIADAPPPPLHIIAAPLLRFLWFNACIKVTRILAPEHPKGWPNDTAPPFTLTISGFISRIFRFANATTEKASLISNKSICDKI